ncbi:hypothetical protein ACM7KY_17175 [Pseudomonas aeruginosa]
MTESKICTCPSGDGSLRWPCPKHPAVEQAGGDERVVDGKPRATKCPDCGEGDLMPGDLCACGYETDPAAGYACSECDGSGEGCVGEVCRECDGSGWFVTPEQARAALAQPSPASDLDPFNLAPHAEAFNEAHDEALRPEQAEAERPDVVAVVRAQGFGRVCEADANALYQHCSDGETLMTVAQHERIVKAWIECWKAYIELSAKIAAQRDAALARVAELEAKLSDPTAVHQWQFSNAWFDGSEEVVLKAGKEGSPIRTLYAAPVAQAQHSVPEGFREKFKQCMELAFAEIAYYVSPEKARDPNSRARKAGALATELLAMLAAAPGKEGL